MAAGSPELVTPLALARRYSVTVATVRRWVRQRRVPFIRASRKVVRFDLAAVELALASPTAMEGGA